MDALKPDPASSPRPRRPEILAPAGDPLALRAAIAAGADAVYLGMARFNARGRAERFRGVTLAACVRSARSRGVKVYVTLNTLIHDDELARALDLAAEALEAGAAAAIVQDLGLAALLRESLPGLSLHGSTQMTAHQPEQAAALVKLLGLERVIVARECSVDEVKRISERLRPLGADVEVFVHGALCFAYSGQCLMSNFAGRRSANRGICAQNCRFDFSAGPVERAGGPGFQALPVLERRSASQLLSMKDLAAFESVATLADAGVGSFKIEGRLKGPEYVAEVTRLYRAALDAWEARAPFSAQEAERAAGRVFSRGFTNGYLSGRVDAGMRGDKRSLEGEPDAIVVSANRNTGDLVLEARAGHAVRPGQGYRYVHDRYRGGFRVIAVEDAGRGRRAVLARVRFGAEAAGRRHRRGAAGRRRPPPPLPEGLACYLNDDPELEKRIEKLVAGVEIAAAPEPVAVRIGVRGRVGEPLRARALAADGRTAEAASPGVLDPARSRPLDAALLEEHLGRLGGTRYRLAAVDAAELAPGLFLGFPALHALRRQIVEALDAARGASLQPASPRPGCRLEACTTTEARSATTTALSVCVATPKAYGAALRAGANRVIVGAPRLLAGDPRALDEWAPLLRGAQEPWVRLPPVVHDEADDRRAIDVCAGISPRSGVVAGHMGQMALARRADLRISADLHLNACNHRTLQVLTEAGAIRSTLSLEVDAREAARVASLAPRGIEVEVVAGGAVFSMLTRQAYGLGDDERFFAVSEHGHGYRFEASAGITTLFEARELVGAEMLPHLAGKVHSVRLDLAHHRAEAVEEIVAAYRRCLDAIRNAPESPAASAAAAAAAEVHRRHAPHGHFAGHLARGARALDEAT